MKLHINSRKRLALIIVSVAFAILGLVYVFGLLAETPYLPSEPETGNITTPATPITDTTASGGKAIKFGTATTTRVNPYGYVDYCGLEGTNTVIYGWANDPDASDLNQPSVTMATTGHTVTAPTNISPFRDAPINAYIDTLFPGDPKPGTYGFKAVLGTLNKGTSFPVSGTVINSGAGVDVPIKINTTGTVDGDTTKPIFRNGIIPDACLGGAPNPDTKKFTIVVMPDTQFATSDWPADLTTMTTWIANNKTALNIVHVIHVGDVVDSATDTQYNRAHTSINVLDNKVPYILAIGNHDIRDGSGTAAVMWNKYFPLRKFDIQPTFAGNFPAGKSNALYHKFTAGGTDWGIVTLMYGAPDADIAWVNKTIAANPARRFIFATHNFLTPSSTRSSEGQKYWDRIVKNYKNMQMTLSGHVVCCGFRNDPGVNGNRVFQVLSDYQNSSNREANTNLRIMTFDPVTKTVTVKTYSPVFNKYRTDSPSNFVISNFPFGPIY